MTEPLRSDNIIGIANEENLPKELIQILETAQLSKSQTHDIMLHLLPYIIGRDHAIFSHAYSAGRASV